jgi:hypothetical protein
MADGLAAGEEVVARRDETSGSKCGRLLGAHRLERHGGVKVVAEHERAFLRELRAHGDGGGEAVAVEGLERSALRVGQVALVRESRLRPDVAHREWRDDTPEA